MIEFFINVKNRLKKHFEELEKITPIPDNWRWKLDRLKDLDYLDKRILGDIKRIHKTYLDDGRLYQKIREELISLHNDIVSMLQEHEIDLDKQIMIKKGVEQLLDEISEQIPTYIEKLKPRNKFKNPKNCDTINTPYEFILSQNFQFSDFLRGPCIILFYFHKEENNIFLTYGHFDEFHFHEISDFIDKAKKRDIKKIGIFGGFVSENMKKISRILSGYNITYLVENDYKFGSLSGLKFSNKNLELENLNKEIKTISIQEILNMFGDY